ncbi:MAG: hypothetical protein KF715_11740 [Candidatus Didemnitutus sp.]|nr:hypothetical protein [Candidatus Didemnitutus sp.]
MLLLSLANREAIPGDMDPAELPLIVRKPIWPAAAVVVAATAGAVYLVRLPNIYSDPLRFGAVFVLWMIVSGGVGHIFQRKPALEISADGIAAAEWGSTFIRWEEIDRAFVVSRKEGDYLCLTLLRPDDYCARGGSLVRLLVTASRTAGLGDLYLRPSALRLDTNETLRLLNQLASWHRSELKPPASAVRYRTE